MTYTHVLSRVSLVPVRLLYWHFLLTVSYLVFIGIWELTVEH